MGIWTYDDRSRDPDRIWRGAACVFCKASLKQAYHRTYTGTEINNTRMKVISINNVDVCPLCGWWQSATHFRREGEGPDTRRLLIREETLLGACGSLRELDLTDLRTPIAEVRDYLMAKYDARYDLHPRLLEETVASVFALNGYDATATAYSGDDGIDVILRRGEET